MKEDVVTALKRGADGLSVERHGAGGLAQSVTTGRRRKWY